ncbi:hypothetical protein [uncultured Gilvimarinus sp.]|uniref:hypothetical protein n=1 Tax=uncultured Gilvimarinus sp. TaxID=1689143 RepID=UPI0030ED5219
MSVISPLRRAFFISLTLLPLSSIASECEISQWAKSLDCASEFTQYYEALQLSAQAVKKMDINGLASLEEKVLLANDKTINCSSISRDETEDRLLINVIGDEVSLISSIRAYLKYHKEGPYVVENITEDVVSNYKQLVDSVISYNHFVESSHQTGRIKNDVSSAQCGR